VRTHGPPLPGGDFFYSNLLWLKSFLVKCDGNGWLVLFYPFALPELMLYDSDSPHKKNLLKLSYLLASLGLTSH